MTTEKRPTAVRLSGTGRDLLERVAQKLGVSRSAVIEMAVRLIAEREGIHVKEDDHRGHEANNQPTR